MRLSAFRGLMVGALVGWLPACSSRVAEPHRIDLTQFDVVDLTHAFDAQTIYWPNAPSAFVVDTLARGPVPGGWFYSASRFASPEHGGTHLDAPIHFDAEGRSSEAIPVSQFLGPAVVIDVTAQAQANPDYRLTADDVYRFERAHGPIGRGMLVLLRTGWSARWPDRKAYLGDDRPGRTDALHFPSFGEDAAALLVQSRQVAALGVDAASIDGGQSTAFRVHRLAAAHNVIGLENLANLEALPPTGATLIALPMKIRGGTGGPLRAVALVPRAPGATPRP